MSWRLIKYLSVLTLAFGVAALAYSAYIWNVMAIGSGACEIVTDDTLRLKGSVDAGMKSCALEMLTPDIKTIIVDSPGGETFAGRAIGNRIGDVPRKLVVDGICFSACGNYFVPAATEVALTKGSIVGLHGTPDPFSHNQYDYDAMLNADVKNGRLTVEQANGSRVMHAEQIEAELAEEAAFAARFNVPPGWRMYREADDAPGSWTRHFTPGSDAGLKPADMLIVEGPMMASCLPHVKTNNWQASLDQTVFNTALLWTTYKLSKAYRSRGLTCAAQ